MIVAEMFAISYDLSWFSSLKNSHILLLVQIMVHIDDVTKNAYVIKNIFCLIFCVVSCIVKLFDVFWRRLKHTLLFLISLSMSSSNTR